MGKRTDSVCPSAACGSRDACLGSQGSLYSIIHRGAPSGFQSLKVGGGRIHVSPDTPTHTALAQTRDTSRVRPGRETEFFQDLRLACMYSKKQTTGLVSDPHLFSGETSRRKDDDCGRAPKKMFVPILNLCCVLEICMVPAARGQKTGPRC